MQNTERDGWVQGEYRTFYSGNVEGKRQHGVGIYMRIRHTTHQRATDVGIIRDDIRCNTSSFFYSTLEQQVTEVRKKYGSATKIIILGDFNARVGTDGADNKTEEYNDNDEACVNGVFRFEETGDNGAELLTFCVAQQFKVMDSYFERRDGEYGTWACNRNKDKGFHAILDHILVSRDLWGEVIACVVHIPVVVDGTRTTGWWN